MNQERIIYLVLGTIFGGLVYFSPWFAIPSAILTVYPIVDQLMNKETQELKRMRERVTKVERVLQSNRML